MRSVKDKNICIDTNILIHVGRRKEVMFTWKTPFKDVLNQLWKNNHTAISLITKYEIAQWAIDEKEQKYFENVFKAIPTLDLNENTFANLVALQKNIFIKKETDYQDKLILANAITNFWTQFYILGSDQFFLQPCLKKFIVSVKDDFFISEYPSTKETLIGKNEHALISYYLIEYDFSTL